MSRRIAKELLPLPWVSYPFAFGGAFPGFRERPDSPIFFCSCQRTAIHNRLALWAPGIHGVQLIRTGFKLPDTEDFPWDFWKPIADGGARSDADFVSQLRFAEGVCHECNRRVPATPALRPPSTDAFGTLFRCYLRKEQFHAGVDMMEGWILEDRCTDEIKVLVPPEPLLYRKSDDPWHRPYDSLFQRREVWARYRPQVHDAIVVRTRSAFGFPARGPRLTSETILYLRTCAAFPDCCVVRHYRPRGLRGLSVDVYIPELKVGIEYQGAQHFEALEHWGGETAFKATRHRDERKKAEFQKLGISIVEFQGNVTFIDEGDIRYRVQQAKSNCAPAPPPDGKAPRIRRRQSGDPSV